MEDLQKRVAMYAAALGIGITFVALVGAIVKGPDLRVLLAMVPFVGCGILAVLGWRRERAWMTIGSGVWLLGVGGLVAMLSR